MSFIEPSHRNPGLPSPSSFSLLKVVLRDSLDEILGFQITQLKQVAWVSDLRCGQDLFKLVQLLAPCVWRGVSVYPVSHLFVFQKVVVAVGPANEPAMFGVMCVLAPLSGQNVFHIV